MPSSTTRARAVASSRPLTALTLVFGLNGLLLAQLMARMPSVRDQVDASPAQLGAALLASGIGSIIAMPWTARVAERFGSPRVVLGGVLVASLAWLALPLTTSPLTLAAVLLVVGVGIGVWDVSMNVQGNTLEHRHRRVYMPRLHAGYSAGTVVGAITGGTFAAFGVPLRVQVWTLVAVVFVVLVACVRRLVPDAHARRGEPTGSRATPRRGLTRVEIVLGLLTMSGALAEGAANDWLALVLVDARGAVEAVGALTFAAFNVAMTVGRLAGGRVISRRGRVLVLRTCGTTAAVGVLLVALVPSLAAAVLGGLLWGLGVAVVFPAAMSAAGDVPGRGPRAIGVVSTIGYAGFLAGAPTIGLVAEVVGLDLALLVVAGACALIVVLAGSAHERRPGASPPATAARR